MARIIVVTNLKGGSSKTTTSAFLGQAFHGAGLKVLLVDTDPQGSLMRWAELAEWPMTTVALPVATVHTRVLDIVGDHDVVIIDTPPIEDRAQIVRSAMRVADLVVVTTAPTPLEVDRVPAVREVLDDVADLRRDGQAPPVAVLLTRTTARATSTRVWREQLQADGWQVLDSHVRTLQIHSQAGFDPITKLGDYEYVAEELVDLLMGDDA